MTSPVPDPDHAGIGPPRSFDLDEFQVKAMREIDAGNSVVVSAPTGSGKTYIAEHGLAMAHTRGRRGIYTTPVKALSNQKYRDLRAWMGAEAVGLLTGDNSINGDGSAVVMTTEVLRNMLYTQPERLFDIDVVVMDEVHYLQDNYRGPVWEEVIIHLPEHIHLIALSATVSNADELAAWITAVHRNCVAVTEKTRPVALDSKYFVAERTSRRYHLVPTLRRNKPNPEGRRFDIDRPRNRKAAGGRRDTAYKQRFRTPRRVEVIEELDRRNLLPAITFIFSRAGCEDAVTAMRRAGIGLTDDVERRRILEIAEQRTGYLSDGDKSALAYDTWLRGLEAGVAAHHAGIVPVFKETVEELFAAGLLKAVFATETLALGINMPARTVVIEKLSKFTGEHHETLSAADYTQLTGRAGRRGIDDRGYAFVLWTPFTTFDEVVALAKSQAFELRSAFRPTYNMTCHLVSRYTRGEAEALIASSFGQFQTDRAVKALQQRRDDLRVRLGMSESSEAGAVEDLDVDVTAVLAEVRPGDVLWLGHDSVAVLSTSWRRKTVNVRVVDRDGHVHDLDPDGLEIIPVVVESVRLPEPFNPNSGSHQIDVAGQLRNVGRPSTRSKAKGQPRPAGGRAEPWKGSVQADARKELKRVEARIRERRGRLSERFKAVIGMLSELGYIDMWELTDRGTILLGTFHELDLVLVESLLAGHLDGHDPATLAGIVATFIYEPRRAESEPDVWFSTPQARQAVDGVTETLAAVNRLESAYGLPESRMVDPGLFAAAHGWTAGGGLGDILAIEHLSGGDFVRLMKQLVDVLSQLANVAPEKATRQTARMAVEAIQRGVVDVPLDATAVETNRS